MEHFHLPLGMWMVGLLISLFCFLAEIISNWITKRSTGRLSDDMEGAEVDQVQVLEDPDKLVLPSSRRFNTDLQDNN